jgi:GNAT superfamily N-acetyltransferase
MNYIFKEILEGASLKDYECLFLKCFPGNSKLNVEYLKWLYLENPEGKVIGFDAFESGILVAHYAVVPRIYFDGTTMYKAVLSVNTATHPSHQGKGLFTKLAESTYAKLTALGFDFVIGIANSNSIYSFVNKLDFRMIGQVKIGLTKNPKYLSNGMRKYINSSWINWRMSNPSMKYYLLKKNKEIIICVNIKGIPFYLTKLKADSVDLDILKLNSKNKFTQILGLTPYYNTDIQGTWTIPNFLQPSPWFLIVRKLSTKLDDSQMSEIKIDGLSMDTF